MPQPRRQDGGSVTIITPFLNPGAFLEEAIRSVVAQTFDSWELLLVDDGSEDQSTAIATDYAARFGPKIRYFEHHGHAHRGTSASRNVGLRAARGKFIAFLDADDVYLPHKLAAQVSLLEGYPTAGMVYDRALYWHGWTGLPEDIRRDNLTFLGVVPDRLYQPPELLTLIVRNEDAHPCPASLLLRRDVCEVTGGFDETFQIYEDTVFLAKVLLRTPTLVSGDCSAKYRQHAGSTCMKAMRDGFYDQQRPNEARGAYLRWLEHYLPLQDVADAALHRALRRALWPYRHPRTYRLLDFIKRRGVAGRNLLQRPAGRGIKIAGRGGGV